MVSDESVNLVKAAVVRFYAERERPTRATNAELQRAAGVSHKTFYRVREDRPDVAAYMKGVEDCFLARPAAPPTVRAAPSGPHADAAVEELVAVIASLTAIVHEQSEVIAELERSLEACPESGTRDATGSAVLVGCPCEGCRSGSRSPGADPFTVTRA